MSQQPTVLITGVGGQDGIYLARLLLEEGCRVVGTVSPYGEAGDRLRIYAPGVELAVLDVRDEAALAGLVARARPNQIYNLAAVSSVARSWQEPELTFATNTTPVATLLAAMLALREQGHEPRLFQASSAEVAQGESPYARSKARAAELVAEARREHGLFAAVGTLFNHESPLRGEQFVTRKITRSAVEIAAGRRDRLELGSLDVRRDWGYAGDHVRAMRAMLAHTVPVDVEIGTGVPHSLHDLVAVAFAAVGLADPSSYVVSEPSLVRPADAAVLVADPEPAAAELGWRATTSFEATIEAMVAADRQRLASGPEESLDYLRP